jgi:hypothetical protein
MPSCTRQATFSSARREVARTLHPLCSRAVGILERQLQLRALAMRAGLVKHEHLFSLSQTYMARHTSVSWNLMIGRNPLLVAKEHGHRLTTMLSVYAAWTERCGGIPHPRDP